MTEISKGDGKEKVDRYERAYNWSLRVFNQHIERYERQERKATRYLTGAGILLGLIGFSGGAIANRLTPLSGFLDWVVLISGLCTVGCLFWLCYSCFRVLRTEDLKVFPSDTQVIDLFHKYSESAVLDRLSRDIAREARENKGVTVKMGRYLDHAHKALIGVTIFAVVFGTGLVVKEVSTLKESPPRVELNIFMPDSDSSPSANPEGEGSSNPNGGDEPSGSENPSGAQSRPGNEIDPVEFPTIESSEEPDYTTKSDSANERSNSNSNTSSWGSDKTSDGSSES